MGDRWGLPETPARSTESDLRIGIDFDNTIACYDGVFRRAAIERGLVPATIGLSKSAVRDHLRAEGRDHLFTELQGYVYGARMDLASVYPGAIAFIAAAREEGHLLVLVSHKTRLPFAGPPYDLHAAARGFLDVQGLVGPGAFAADDVYFETTKEAKVARAVALGCEVFIDDLPEILSLPGWPAGMRAILFDPDRHHADSPRFERHATWSSIQTALLGPTS